MMKKYTVNLVVRINMAVHEDTPFDAYRKARNFVTDHLNDIFDNMSFSVVEYSTTDESGNRVTAIVITD